MSDEEKIELDVLLKNLLHLLRLTMPKFEEHSKKLEQGNERMHGLEMALQGLSCGEHVKRIENNEKLHEEAKRYRRDVTIFVGGVILSIIGIAMAWGALLNRVSNVEKFLDKFEIVVTTKHVPAVGQ